MAKKKIQKNIFDRFGYDIVNGVEQYGRYEPAGDGKGLDLVGYGRYIAIERIAKDLDNDSPIITIGYETLDGVRGTVNIRRELLGKKRELQALLLKCNADAFDNSLSVLMGCLRVSEETADKALCYRRTGWITKDVGTENELLCFKGSSLIAPPKASIDAEYVGTYDLSSKGSFTAWKSMVRKHVIGSAALEVAVLIGLSSIISSEWGARSLIFHFMGDSSTGKTSSALLALSTISCPNPAETAKRLNPEGKPLRSLMSSWKGTGNALIAKLDGLDGTTMAFDEISKVENPEILTSTIYTISDGTTKDRMSSGSEMQATSVIRTNVLSVGEESLLEKANNKNTGLNMRVCEICTTFTSSAEQAEAITTGCYENYGHAGPRFAKYIVDNMSHTDVADLRLKNLAEYTAVLTSKGCLSASVRRLAEFGAILLTVADISKDALGLDFSRDEIIEFLSEQQLQSEANVDIGLRAHEALRGFVNANIAAFITGSASTWTKSITCLGKVEHAKDGSMVVGIVTTEFPKIMAQLKFNNPNLIISKFKSLGFLDHEAGKTYRKRKLTNDGSSVRVYVIRFE